MYAIRMETFIYLSTSFEYKINSLTKLSSDFIELCRVFDLLYEFRFIIEAIKTFDLSYVHFTSGVALVFMFCLLFIEYLYHTINSNDSHAL